MKFEKALKALRKGKHLRRKGLNWKGIYVALMKPGKKSDVSLPYLYICTDGLVTNNKHAPKGSVPWLPSQTDILAKDWEELDQLSDVVEKKTTCTSCTTELGDEVIVKPKNLN